MKSNGRKIFVALFYLLIVKLLFVAIVSFSVSSDKYEQKKLDVKTKLHNQFKKNK